MSEQSKRQLSMFSIIGRMAKETKTAYVTERRLWKGSRNGDQQQYNPPSRLEDSWRTFAEALMSHAIFDCRAFTRYQFQRRNCSALCPEPRVCYGPKAIQNWKQYCRDYASETAKELQLALKLNLEHYQIELQRLQAMRHACDWTDLSITRIVLLDRTTPISALFRYCYAAKQELTEIADFYFDAALFDYLFDRRQYDEIWGNAITRELQSAADELCRVAKHATTTYGER